MPVHWSPLHNRATILVLSQTDTDLLALEQARHLLPPGFAPLRLAHIGRLNDDAAVDALLDELLPEAVVVLARLHGTRSFTHGLARMQGWAASAGRFLLCLPAVEALDPDLTDHSSVGAALVHAINSYVRAGGPANLANALQCLSDQLLGTGWGYEPPQELPRHGIYRRAAAAGPRIGLLFYRAHLLSGNTTFVDGLIAEIDRQGMQTQAVFTQSLKECDAQGESLALRLLHEAGPPEAIICTLSFAAGQGMADMATAQAAQGPPVFQALCASASREEWLHNGRGLGPLDTAMNVAIPEFDGRIIGVPISFKETEGADGPARYQPDAERIARMVGLVHRQVALRQKPNASKRIAVVLTNSSAKAQRVGNAVGLDAPASLMQLLQSMQAAGYHVENLPTSGDELIAALIARCAYDQNWLSETQLAQAACVSSAQYNQWFAELPEVTQAAMVAQWGEPPGTAFVHAGGLALARLELGNLLVALQPPRGYDLDPNAVYHNPTLPPPHHYYALYRWLREVWGADAIIHMGKHGTLEWLPGKGVGLSADCFPDQFLADLPLVYPFIINDPGEGSQAKRRAHAVLIDHLPPPMASAGAYGPLVELAQLVDDYYQAEQLDPSKLPLLQRQIWQLMQRHRLDDDLRYLLRDEQRGDSMPPALAELEGRQVAHLLEDLEGYLCELTSAQIRDGLHILGTLPAGDGLVELVYHLLRLPNLHVPSLPASVAALLGEDWDSLQARPGARRPLPRVVNPGGASGHSHSHPPGMAACGPRPARLIELESPPGLVELRTNADTLAFIEAESKQLLATLASHDWDVQHVDVLVHDWLYASPDNLPVDHAPGSKLALPISKLESPISTLQSAIANLQSAITYACTQIIPALRQGAHDELAHTLAALNGAFVPPGPSGAPTRGMAHVLPTGRNFYAVDPRAVPSVAAWDVGQRLADDLLARYRQEHGDYPTSVGISIWGTSAMRTSGDDVAQVLALLGVRPRWQAENRRVLGIEVVPLAELGRPRIDVVCRISGFFRDAFPQLISLIDEAVHAVVSREEPLAQNGPRRHALAAEARLLATGMAPAEAARESRYRLFGSAPGSYGAGILPLLDGQNWRSDADLAEVYLSWGGYAYTSQADGVYAREAFAQALSGVQVATKNQDNHEHDLFDSDDYLQYHGGMIATIRALTGQHPARYLGDSSDPARPRTRDLREEARRVFRSRVVNPKWLASMQRHGYKGGLELAATVDYLYGYDATAHVLDDWMYEQVAERYLLDPTMQTFLEQANPWALQAMTERLLEAHQRGLWQAPAAATLAALHNLALLAESTLEGRTG